MIVQDNWPKEQAGITILISEKIDFRLKLIRDGKGHYMDITILTFMHQTQGQSSSEKKDYHNTNHILILTQW